MGIFPEPLYLTDFDTNTRKELVDEITRLRAENERLSNLCDKWNNECDEMREDNRRLDKELVVAKAEIERLKDDWKLALREIDIKKYKLAARDLVIRQLRMQLDIIATENKNLRSILRLEETHNERHSGKSEDEI